MPGKIFIPIRGNEGSLEIIVNKIKKRFSNILIATTTNKNDDDVDRFCTNFCVDCFRGSENDVLDRFYKAAIYMGSPDSLIRITADCPFLDVSILKKVIQLFYDTNADYASNINPPTFPDGLDVEVFSFKSLERAWKEAKDIAEREHVTFYIRRHPEIFKIVNFSQSENMSSLSWTLNKDTDLRFIRETMKYLPENFVFDDILNILKQHPEISKINEKTITNEWAKVDRVFFDGLHGA